MSGYPRYTQRHLVSVILDALLLQRAATIAIYQGVRRYFL
jgi:hypothetical protein